MQLNIQQILICISIHKFVLNRYTYTSNRDYARTYPYDYVRFYTSSLHYTVHIKQPFVLALIEFSYKYKRRSTFSETITDTSIALNGNLTIKFAERDREILIVFKLDSKYEELAEILN